jgi:hypothetical protein
MRHLRAVRSFVSTTMIAVPFTLMVPQGASAMPIVVPTQRLVGLAQVQDQDDQVVKLTVDVEIGAFADDDSWSVLGGRSSCGAATGHTLGGVFSPSSRGSCPGHRGVVVSGSYEFRPVEPIGDVTLDVRWENGTSCTISGITLANSIGGPLQSLVGTMECTTSSGTPLGKSDVELVRRPFRP